MNCLIVEDDLVCRYMLKEMLPASFVADIVVNGKEAIAAFKSAHANKKPFDLIFMDVEMPVLDGIPALQKIREIEREMEIPVNFEVKVIMTTSHDEPRTVIDSFNKGGAISYIIKPVKRNELMAELSKLGLLPHHLN